MIIYPESPLRLTNPNTGEKIFIYGVQSVSVSGGVSVSSESHGQSIDAQNDKNININAVLVNIAMQSVERMMNNMSALEQHKQDSNSKHTSPIQDDLKMLQIFSSGNVLTALNQLEMIEKAFQANKDASEKKKNTPYDAFAFDIDDDYKDGNLNVLAARGIKKVIFQSMSSSISSTTEAIEISLSFIEAR